MTGNNKLFKTYYKGQEVFVHAATAIQAAVAIAEKLKVKFINPDYVREAKPLWLFKCWYISYDRTQYIYIAAKSAAQAWFYYCQEGYIFMRDHMNKNNVLGSAFREAPVGTSEGSIFGENSSVAF